MSKIIDKLKKVIQKDTIPLPDDKLVVLITKPTGQEKAVSKTGEDIISISSSPDIPLVIKTCNKTITSDGNAYIKRTANSLANSPDNATHAVLVAQILDSDDGTVLKSQLLICSHPTTLWRQPGSNKFKAYEMESLILSDTQLGAESISQFLRGLAWYELGFHEAALRLFTPMGSSESSFYAGLALCHIGVKNHNMGQELEAAFKKFSQAMETASEEQGELALVTYLNTASCLQHMARLNSEGVNIDLYDKAIGSYESLIQMLQEDNSTGLLMPACLALGAACLEKAMKLSDDDKNKGLLEALKAYEAAIAKSKLGTVDWALAKAGVGNVEREIGTNKEEDKAIEHLNASVDNYKKALTILTSIDTPWQYAETASGLATTQMEISEMTRGEEKLCNLLESAQLFKNVMEIWTEESNPGDWATAKNNLGNNQYLTASCLKPEKALQYINDSIQSYETALTIFTETHFQVFHQGVTMNMAKAKLLRSTLQKTLGIDPSEGAMDGWDSNSSQS
ncbi:MAG TPA: hypothetical protein QF720_06925 [Nitrospinota bacterium]|nr:hypothetical protein [Nitrospinota bacterium]|tara:strand:+ start:89287 stop:90816 length:1530 start_codon:yes stop_codon:yes gene_type:complete